MNIVLVAILIISTGVSGRYLESFDNVISDETIENDDYCENKDRSLYIHGKELPKIEAYFANDSCIKTLGIWSNGIKSISSGAFDGLPNLMYLDLSNNDLAEIFSFGAHKTLVAIAVNNNSFPDLTIDFSRASGKYPNLFSIDLRNSRIAKLIGDSSVDLPMLKEINLSRTNLKTTKNLPKTVSRLYLNDAAELDSGEFEKTLQNVEELYLNSNTHFKYLDAPDSKICDKENLCLNLPNLRSLSLERNSIRAVSSTAFSKLQDLHFLYLKGSSLLPSIPGTLLKSIPKLNLLDISETNFYSEPNLEILTELTILKMNDMVDKSKVIGILRNFELSLNVLQKLEYLSIQGNELGHESLPSLLFKLNSLKELILSRNKIKKLKFPGEMAHLQSLEMSSNLISDIDDVSVDRMPLLKYLDLSNNPVARPNKTDFSFILKI